MLWWVRVTLRRERGSRLFLVLLCGVSVGVVAAAWQAQRRGTDSVQRLTSSAGAADEVIFACPQGLGVKDDPSLDQCATRATADSAELALRAVPDVRSTDIGAPLVIALLDPHASNGWGRATIAYASAQRGLVCGRPIVVAGRLPSDGADDEIAVTEAAASRAGLRVGEVVRLAGWTSLDGQFDVPPDSTPFESRVVGIIRSTADIAPPTGVDVTGTELPDGIYAGPAWTARHANGLFAYGWGVLVHLSDGRPDAFNTSLKQRWTDRLFQTGAVVDADLPALEHSISTEGTAVAIFAIVGAVASLAALALGLNRLLRRDTADTATLASLGAARTELRAANTCAAVAVGVPSALLATVVCFMLSPFSPVGLARRAETDIGLRLDLTVATCSILAILAVSAVVGATAAIGRVQVRSRRVGEPSLVRRSTARLGAVPRAAASFLAGGTSRTAIALAAVAIATTIASAGLIASFDRVERHPARYGAWWNVVVGDYSNADALDGGLDAIRRNPNVQAAATLGDTDATINGKSAQLISISRVFGNIPSTISSGRAPNSSSEIALGATLAASLHVKVGDTVSVEASDNGTVAGSFTVVGLAVLDNPTALDVSPGDGALVTRGATGSARGQVDQSILVRFDPSVGSGQAMRSILSQFNVFVVRAAPESDVSNLGRIRAVPWFIAALVGSLALATFTHSMVTTLRRRRTELAVLAAIGMTRRQLRLVTLSSAVAMVLTSSVLGIVIGAAGGRALWNQLASRLGLASGPVVEALPIAAVIIIAVAFAATIAGVAHALGTRRGSGDPLRAT